MSWFLATPGPVGPVRVLPRGPGTSASVSPSVPYSTSVHVPDEDRTFLRYTPSTVAELYVDPSPPPCPESRPDPSTPCTPAGTGGGWWACGAVSGATRRATTPAHRTGGVRRVTRVTTPPAAPTGVRAATVVPPPTSRPPLFSPCPFSTPDESPARVPAGWGGGAPVPGPGVLRQEVRLRVDERPHPGHLLPPPLPSRHLLRLTVAADAEAEDTPPPATGVSRRPVGPSNIGGDPESNGRVFGLWTSGPRVKTFWGSLHYLLSEPGPPVPQLRQTGLGIAKEYRFSVRLSAREVRPTFVDILRRA